MADKRRDREVHIASLSLVMDQSGELIYLDGQGLPLGSLKEMLNTLRPDWALMPAKLEAARWIQEQIIDVQIRVSERFKDNESVCLQERDVPTGEEDGWYPVFPESE
mgnify:CR=1 FL=1|jgi:hypothetical protein